MRIVRIANFVSPTSGGIKTALREWGQAYRARGHEVSLIIPGPGAQVEHEAQGDVYRVPALPVGGTGYSLILRRSAVASLLELLRPDTIEVSDRSTLRWTGRWARRHGVGSVMISHEHLTGILDRRTPVPDRPAHALADAVNRRSAGSYDAIVCPSTFAAGEFTRIGVPAQVVPLGVDLGTFRPGPAPSTDPAPGVGRPVQVIHCGRLSPEKNPGLSVQTLRTLLSRGLTAELTVLGTGPLRDRLIDSAEDLPVTFRPYLTDRSQLAAEMALADVAVAPGPVETFGLAALEALACGVPTVCPVEGALGEVVGDGGVVARSHPGAFADGVVELLRRPGAREAARRQAERFTWEASADRMLTIHERVRHVARR
jgi:alpha-1,6-mannosyltransferase